MIRIAVDGCNLNKPRGLGRYLQELLYAVGRHPIADMEFEVLVSEGTDVPQALRADNIAWRVLKASPFPVWEQATVPRALAGGTYDLVHFPNNTATMRWSAALPRRLVTVHDLTFLTEPGVGWYQKLGAIYRRHVVKSLMRQQLDLLTDSAASAEDISRHFGRDAEVVHISVDYFHCSLGELPSEGAPSLGLKPGEYFIHIGGISSHKNTARVIEAFNKANLQGRQLVVLGVPADGEMARREGSDRVLFPGWLSNAAVAGLIQQARAMIFPSLREGYGMPIVEAFALGCAVVTTNFAPMSELAGEACLLVDPMDTSQMVEVYRRLAADDGLVTRLKDAGSGRRSKFGAEHMAARMGEIYRKAVSAGVPKQ